MEDNANILSGSLVQNLKSNWLDIVIILGVFIVLLVVVSVIRRRLRRLFESRIPEDRMMLRKRTLTFNSVVSNLIIVIAFIAAALIIAGELGISVTPLLAGAGVAGIVVGFGAQSLIKDLINGIFILFEQWYQVGDIVTIGSVTGAVERFNLRTTMIRDIEGTIHFFPNGEIAVLGNRTNLWSRAVVSVGVHYKENTDRVIEVLKGIFDDIMKNKEYNKSILEKPSLLGGGGVSDLGDSSVIFKVVCKVKAGEQWNIERQLKKRIKDRFDEEGIEISYPCTNVYIRNDK